ncbi:ALP1-like protein isoform X1 [Tanacetum coccineum]
MDFPECSGVLIVCIEIGETAESSYVVNSRGKNTDLDLLYGSPLFDDVLVDRAPEAPFVVNGRTYNKCYYLADGIYPTWATFVKMYYIARDEKTLKFKRVQEKILNEISEY